MQQNYQLIVEIPHTNFLPKQRVLYSMYHLWEHIFIKIIKFGQKENLDVWGYTVEGKTVLIIETDTAIDSDRIVAHIKKRKVSNKNLFREYSIIANEICFLKKHKNPSLKFFPHYSKNARQLRYMCKMMFDLENIIVRENQGNHSGIGDYLDYEANILLKKPKETSFIIDDMHDTYLDCLIEIILTKKNDCKTICDVMRKTLQNNRTLEKLLSQRYHITNIVCWDIINESSGGMLRLYLFCKKEEAFFFNKILENLINDMQELCADELVLKSNIYFS